MNLDHLKIQCKDQINEHISIICQNPHYFEYSMPEPEGSSVTIIYDWSDTDDIVGILFPGLRDKQKSDKCLEVAMAKLEEHTNEVNPGNLCNFDMDDIQDTHIFRITLWTKGNQELREQIIDDYIQALRYQVVQSIENASGDDSYYDYAPGFYDVFRQVCQLFGGKYIDLYNQTTSDLYENDEDLELYGPDTIQ